MADSNPFDAFDSQTPVAVADAKNPFDAFDENPASKGNPFDAFDEPSPKAAPKASASTGLLDQPDVKEFFASAPVSSDGLSAEERLFALQPLGGEKMQDGKYGYEDETGKFEAFPEYLQKHRQRQGHRDQRHWQHPVRVCRH